MELVELTKQLKAARDRHATAEKEYEKQLNACYAAHTASKEALDEMNASHDDIDNIQEQIDALVATL